MPRDIDRPSVGAITGSTPKPSPTPQAYQPFTVPGAFELKNNEGLTFTNNRIDHLKLRVDLLDEVARVLLEGEDYNNGELTYQLVN